MSIIRAARPQSNFYVLDKQISEDRRLSWAARGLLIFLLGKPDHWQVSVEHLYKESPDKRGNGREAIYGYIKELIVTGYVSRKKRATGEMDYHVSEVPQEPQTANPNLANPNLAQTALVSIEVKQERKVVRTQLEVAPDWIPEESWRDFEEMRRKIRKPLTERAKKMIFAKLDEFRKDGHDPKDVLEQSIVSAWSGVFPLKKVVAVDTKQQREAPWWSSNEAMLKKGREIGLQPRSGESWNDFKGRIDGKLGGAA